MIRKHESAVSRKAALLALGVHGVLLGAMIVSIDWKAAHPPMQVTEVTLWDKLPAKSSPQPPVEVKPEIKPEPKPEPKPEVKEEPKPEVKEPPKPKEEPDPPKVDIELEKKKQEKLAQDKKEKELEEKRKQLAAEMREEQLREEKAEAKKQAELLKKLQNDALSEEKGESDKQASAANASLVNEFTEKIKAKVRGNVNKTLCSDGNPELRFEIGVLPSGELSGTPKLVKSSGSDACDDAVERAIIASEPLPLPAEASAKAQFRNLKLKFRPNE